MLKPVVLYYATSLHKKVWENAIWLVIFPPEGHIPLLNQQETMADDTADAELSKTKNESREPILSSSHQSRPLSTKFMKAGVALMSPMPSGNRDTRQSFTSPIAIKTTSLASPPHNPFFPSHHGDERSSPTSLPLHLGSASYSGDEFRRDRTRASRRSADVLRHLQTLDDERKARGHDALMPRDTKTAAITKDELGGLMNVNQYAIIKELGRGAFAEVKLCKRQYPSITDPTFQSMATGSGEYHTLVSGTGSPKARREEASPSPPRGVSPTSEESRSYTPSPIPMDEEADKDAKDLYAIKVFSKSLLLRRKNFGRNREGRMSLTTDLDKVQREIAIMKKLIHPHLVSLYEVIDDASQDALYLVLEYVPGGPIMDFDAEERRYVCPRSSDGMGVLNEVHAARVLSDMLAGLVYLHVHHIAHRDLKPENVLVGRGGRCKIADFGVAHYFEEEAARILALDDQAGAGASREGLATGTTSPSVSSHEHQLHYLYRSSSRGLLHKSDGTWSFWAPEMCEQGATFSGYSCDVWAAGVCLWAFMFGKLPFQEDSPEVLFEAIRDKELDFPLEERQVSSEVQDLLRRFLQKLPRERITVGQALDHPWVQLADEEEEHETRAGKGEDECITDANLPPIVTVDPDQSEARPCALLPVNPPSPTSARHHSTLRAHAYSFPTVQVSADEIDGAIQSVNNFVLVNKLKRRLTKRLREARASLNRIYSPTPSHGVSPAQSPDHSRSSDTKSPDPNQDLSRSNDERRPSYAPSPLLLPPAIFSSFSSLGSGGLETSPRGQSTVHQKSRSMVGSWTKMSPISRKKTSLSGSTGGSPCEGLNVGLPTDGSASSSPSSNQSPSALVSGMAALSAFSPVRQARNESIQPSHAPKSGSASSPVAFAETSRLKDDTNRNGHMQKSSERESCSIM